jgi:hypothetical protein
VPTQPPIQWVPGVLSLGVKRPVREDDHFPPSSAEVKNEWRYTSTPPVRLRGSPLLGLTEVIEVGLSTPIYIRFSRFSRR